jgi:hypothetical protein
LERPIKIAECPPYYVGRNNLETLLASPNVKDWIKITEMFLGPVDSSFKFVPKHKASTFSFLLNEIIKENRTQCPNHFHLLFLLFL